MRTLSTLHITHYIELSPHPVLLGMGAECVPAGDWLPSLRQGESARAGMLHALQQLYVSGAAVKWTALSPAGRRVPLPLYPFQRRRYWADSLGVMSRRHANVEDFWQHVVPAADAQAACGPIDLSAGSYAETWEVLRRFTVTHVLHTLQTLGVFAEAGDAYTLPSLMTRAGIVPAHGALMTRWLRLLEREGILHEQNTTFELVDGFVTADRHECWAQVSTHLAGNPELLAYIAHCAAQLKDIVTGRTGALESLFPNGTFELATNLYERSATMRYINQLAASCAQAACTALSGSRPLRVLEVGGGTGGTTSALLSVLTAERAVYTFTDVSPLFLDRALARFSSHAQLRTALFDIESDAAPQGLPLAHFDLIVGANVVHASRDLRSVLPRLRSLLAPGGLLMLIESTRHLDYSTSRQD